MINLINKTISVTILTTVALIFPSISFAESPVASESPVPVVINQGNAGVVPTPTNSPVITNQGNAGVTSGGSSPVITNQGNAGVIGGSAPIITPPSPVKDSPVTTSSNSGGGRGYVYVNTNPATCSYLNDYLSIKDNNNDIEVTKLQAFLRNTENMDVDINGIFDSKTFQAVKLFQSKYSVDILSPWGQIVPTGRVFYTTKKKINEIYCNSAFPLSGEQLTYINSYKNRPVVNVKPEVKTNINSTSASTTIITPEVIGSDNTIKDSQTSAVSETTFSTKAVKFVKWLFGF